MTQRDLVLMLVEMATVSASLQTAILNSPPITPNNPYVTLARSNLEHLASAITEWRVSLASLISDTTEIKP